MRLNVVAVLLGLITLTLAQANNLNPSGEGFVDPQSLVDCYATQSSNFDACMVFANTTCQLPYRMSDPALYLPPKVTTANALTGEWVLGCGYAYLASKIGCWLESC